MAGSITTMEWWEAIVKSPSFSGIDDDKPRNSTTALAGEPPIVGVYYRLSIRETSGTMTVNPKRTLPVGEGEAAPLRQGLPEPSAGLLRAARKVQERALFST
jgi:hypothetical protein